MRSSSDGNSIAYAVISQQENDPAAGIWITDFKAPPRQVFRGWACAFAVDANDNIFILKGKSRPERRDMEGEVARIRSVAGFWDFAARRECELHTRVRGEPDRRFS